MVLKARLLESRLLVIRLAKKNPSLELKLALNTKHYPGT
jgi:hypothetical protein